MWFSNPMFICQVKFQTFYKSFIGIFLCFILFDVNSFPKCVCITQSNTKQFPALSEPHIFVPSVIPLCMDMHGKSRLLCLSALITKQRCKSSQDSLSLYFDFVPPIKPSRQPKMCFNNPVPLTCNICAGTDASSPNTWSANGTFSNALDMFFLHKFVKPLLVKCACLISSDVIRWQFAMGLDKSLKRHLQ
jgi:hypothetical protein